MTEYMITNYGNEVIVAETKLINLRDGCVIVTWATLWKILTEAKSLSLRIVINEVGDCLLDWS